MDDWILLSIAAADFDAFSAFDFMLSIGVRPLVELSFTPDPLNKDWVSQPASQAATKRYCMACLSFVMPGNFDHLGRFLCDRLPGCPCHRSATTFIMVRRNSSAQMAVYSTAQVYYQQLTTCYLSITDGCETFPTNLTAYTEYIEDFAVALISRYGEDEVASWLFEVYNEADLHWPFEQYAQLYQAAAVGVKAASEKLQVGGPASAWPTWYDDIAWQLTDVPFPADKLHERRCYAEQTGRVINKNVWRADRVEQLIEYCKNNSVPLDFVTTHACKLRNVLFNFHPGKRTLATSSELSPSIRV